MISKTSVLAQREQGKRFPRDLPLASFVTTSKSCIIGLRNLINLQLSTVMFNDINTPFTLPGFGPCII